MSAIRNAFAAVITEQTLAKLAGPASFARGNAYFASGAVTDLLVTKSAIKSRVQGGDEYRVVLTAKRDRLDATCTCPMGEDGNFCKHAVATGLTWLARHGNGEDPAASPEDDELAAVRTHLAAQDKEVLIELLVEQAENDPQLRARLQAAALRGRPPVGLQSQKQAVRKAFAVHGDFVDYHDMPTFVARAEAVPSLLEALLRSGRAQEAVATASYALQLGIETYEKTDDSDGAFGDVLRTVAGSHLQACKRASIDGELLGQQLFELHMIDDWGLLNLQDYASLLGAAGLARYRAAAEKVWRQVPARLPGARRDGTMKHYPITRLMEELTRHAGDLDALIAIKSRDLSSQHAHLEIARLLADAGRRDEALQWAERGYREPAFANELNVPLTEFLVDAYLQRKRHADAAQAAWAHFSRYPSLDSYRLLERAAQPAGTWSEWRSKALDHLHAELKNKRRDNQRWHWHYGGHSLLVEIHLGEDNPDAAVAEAKAGGCTEALWLRLAQACEKTRAQDAIAIYQARIDPIVDRKSNHAYEEAAQLIARIKRLMEKSGRRREFVDWLLKVKVRHKAKRNFMRLLGEELHG